MTDIHDRTGEVLIIGAGPAGLAMARALAARRLPYHQVERHTGVGGIWDIESPGTPMYEAAHFISSKTLSGFGGFPMPDHFPDYPSHREVLSYLQDFADAYGLTETIDFGVAVESLTKRDDGRWVAHFSDGRVAAYGDVVCCSGLQWVPNLPETPGDYSGEIMHSNAYRDIDQLAGKRVLVVGGGNSGCDIAVDASRVAATARLSLRRGYWFIPKHIFGMPSDVFAETGPQLPMRIQQSVFEKMLTVLYGAPEKLGLPKPDHRLFETHPVLNSTLFHALQHGDLRARPAIRTTSGSTVTFTDGSAEDFDLIIYATGYLHAVPYAQDYFGSAQHPDELYLTSFSRRHVGLFALGFIETNSGAYVHLDALAQMIAAHLWDRDHRPSSYAEFRRLIATDRADLLGGIKIDGSPRHKDYVDAHAFTKHRQAVSKQMGWRTLHGSTLSKAPA